MTEHYDCIFRGEVIDPKDTDRVKQRLGIVCKINSDRMESWFSGNTVTIKRGVDKATALRYAKIFRDAGAVLRFVSSNSSAIPKADSRISHAGESARSGTTPILCPQCGLSQEPAPECRRCGLIFAKKREIDRRKAEKAKLVEELQSIAEEYAQFFQTDYMFFHPGIDQDIMKPRVGLLKEKPGEQEIPLVIIHEGLITAYVITTEAIYSRAVVIPLNEIEIVRLTRRNPYLDRDGAAKKAHNMAVASLQEVDRSRKNEPVQISQASFDEQLLLSKKDVSRDDLIGESLYINGELFGSRLVQECDGERFAEMLLRLRDRFPETDPLTTWYDDLDVMFSRVEVCETIPDPEPESVANEVQSVPMADQTSIDMPAVAGVKEPDKKPTAGGRPAVPLNGSDLPEDEGAATCPKCGMRQEPSETCKKCGLIFQKYKVKDEPASPPPNSTTEPEETSEEEEDPTSSQESTTELETGRYTRIFGIIGKVVGIPLGFLGSGAALTFLPDSFCKSFPLIAMLIGWSFGFSLCVVIGREIGRQIDDSIKAVKQK